VPTVAQDVARYTALYIAQRAAGVSATTRLVPLVPLLRRRDWPERYEPLARFVALAEPMGRGMTAEAIRKEALRA
jgi:hypothetical protein